MKQIITLLALFSATLASAQTKGRISGTVQDGSQKTVESATITLLRAKDSSVAKVAAADKTGKFEFENIPEGRYLVAISAIGHQKGFSETVELTGANTAAVLKTVFLVPADKALGAVTVTARKPLIEQRIDRTIVNVEASVTNVGTSALEVLEKAPGVSVDKDGNISLKGKDGVMVLVDGRPTQLGAADLANMLRNMQSNGLDQIEIMTNPPAKYDAAGNAGIINIKTKKNKQVGYTGSVNASTAYGRHFRASDGFTLAYRENKVNLFGNFSHGYGRRTEYLDIQRNFLHDDTKEVLYRFEQNSALTNERQSFNGKIGLDYSLTNKTTLGMSLTGFTTPNSFNSDVTTYRLENGSLAGKTLSGTSTDQKFWNLGANLNFRTVLDSTGREISGDADYVTYDRRSDMRLVSDYLLPSGAKSAKSDTLVGLLPQNIRIYSGKLDYSHPLKNGARFEAGLKASLVKTDNNAVYDTLNNGVAERDRGRSNHFIYEENINAAYLNLSTNLSPKFSLQLGLRLEHTNANGHSSGYRYDNGVQNFLPFDTTFNNNYVQLFPTAYFQYKPNDKNSFVINYGRRIRRPNYESLNPFIEYIDRYTYQQGNPDLKPQISHNVELSHTYRGFLTTTLNYSATNNIIQQVIEQNRQRSETYVKQANIASLRQWGAAVSVGMPINKWWTANLYVNGFYNEFEGVVNNTPISVGAASLMLNGSQQFKLGKNTSAELSGWYRTAGVEGVIKIQPVGMLSIGLSQNVWQNKGTLRLTVRDIFATQTFYGRSQYGTVDAAFQNYNDNRVVTLGFTYRFSKGKVASSRKRNSSAADEQSRVGGGSSN